jgi:hypothetical protein
LLSTAAFAPRIFFADEADARRVIERVNAIHRSVERARGHSIPDWAYRDVLYMLADYSERAFELLQRPLAPAERGELYDAYRRVGTLMRIPELPERYEDWREDRRAHMERDLVYSELTARLYRQYRRQLGDWRYRLLLRVQAALVPGHVRRLLQLDPPRGMDLALRGYGALGRRPVRALAHRLLLPAGFRDAIARLDRPEAAPAPR